MEEKKMEKKERSKKLDYLMAIIANIILFYIFNNLLSWKIPFLTADFKKVLSFLNLSILATIAANFLFFSNDRSWFQIPLRVGLGIISIFVLYNFYLVFPFDFSSLPASNIIEFAIRLGLLLGIVGIVIGLIVGVIKKMSKGNGEG